LASLGSGLGLLSTIAGFFGGGGRSQGRSLDSIEVNSTDVSNKTLTYEEEVDQLKDVDVKSVIETLIESYKKLDADERTGKSLEIEENENLTNSTETEPKKISKRSIEFSKNESKIIEEIEPRIVNHEIITEKPVVFPESFDRSEHIRQIFEPTTQPPRVRAETLPLKTGTGALSFDSNRFDRRQIQAQLHQAQIQTLLKLLEEEEQTEREREERLERLQQYYTNTYRLQNGNQGSYRPSYSSSSYSQPSYSAPAYASPSYSSPSYSQSNYNRIRDDHSHKIYVTNSQGHNEYYIDTTTGQKYRVR